MEQLERFAVQVTEAKRLASSEDVAYSRLALLLLDNVAETLMYHMCRDSMMYDRVKEQHLDMLLRNPKPRPEDLKMIDELKAKVLTPKRKENIESYFVPKVEFLRERKAQGMTSEIGRCLRKLHAYRNEIYHRDKIRPGTLNTAVKIYFHLSCHLLAAYRPIAMHWTRPTPPGLADALGHDFAGTPLDSYPTVAKWLLDGKDLEADGVQLALADHLVGRLEEILETLDWTSETMADLSRQDWTAPIVLTWIQLGDEDAKPFMSLEDLSQMKVPIGQKEIDGWRARANKIRDLTPTTAAFAAFANLEDEIEKVEGPLNELASAVDREVGFRIDEARGK